MASAIRLIQAGYKSVANFNHKDRAECRAEFHRKQGHEARVVENRMNDGTIFYSVYVKIKEV